MTRVFLMLLSLFILGLHYPNFAIKGGDAWGQTQTPLTKEQINERLQQIQIEKRFLQLQNEEAMLKKALENMDKAKAETPKPVVPKKEAK